MNFLNKSSSLTALIVAVSFASATATGVSRAQVPGPSSSTSIQRYLHFLESKGWARNLFADEFQASAVASSQNPIVRVGDSGCPGFVCGSDGRRGSSSGSSYLDPRIRNYLEGRSEIPTRTYCIGDGSRRGTVCGEGLTYDDAERDAYERCKRGGNSGFACWLNDHN